MKRLIALLLSCLLACSASASIVNNSGATSEDSLSVLFYSLDSLGNPTCADSFFILVHAPNGDSVFAEAVTVASARVDSSQLSGFRAYVYTAAVADIDGSGRLGAYTLSITAKRNSPLLYTTSTTGFQLVGWELDDLGDSVGLAAADASAALDSLHVLLDSLRAALDTLQHQDDWVSAFDPETDTVLVPTDLCGSSSGGGAHHVTLVVLDSAAGTALEGAQVTVRDLSQTNLIALGRTNSRGEVAFNLDLDTFAVLAVAPNTVFEHIDTLAVTCSQTDSVFGWSFDPVTPAVPPLCRVYGAVYAFDGSPEPGLTVTARLPGGVARLGTIAVSPLPVTTYTDSAGCYSIDLFPSSLLTGYDSRYELTINRSDGTILRKRITVPDLGMWNLQW